MPPKQRRRGAVSKKQPLIVQLNQDDVTCTKMARETDIDANANVMDSTFTVEPPAISDVCLTDEVMPDFNVEDAEVENDSDLQKLPKKGESTRGGKKVKKRTTYVVESNFSDDADDMLNDIKSTIPTAEKQRNYLMKHTSIKEESDGALLMPVDVKFDKDLHVKVQKLKVEDIPYHGQIKDFSCDQSPKKETSNGPKLSVIDESFAENQKEPIMTTEKPNLKNIPNHDDLQGSNSNFSSSHSQEKKTKSKGKPRKGYKRTGKAKRNDVSHAEAANGLKLPVEEQLVEEVNLKEPIATTEKLQLKDTADHGELEDQAPALSQKKESKPRGRHRQALKKTEECDDGQHMEVSDGSDLSHEDKLVEEAAQKRPTSTKRKLGKRTVEETQEPKKDVAIENKRKRETATKKIPDSNASEPKLIVDQFQREEETNVKKVKTTRVTKGQKKKSSKEKVLSEESDEAAPIASTSKQSKVQHCEAAKPIPKGNKYIGAHTSIAGGLYKAIIEATEIGANAFGFFLKNQRHWVCKPMEEAAAEKFKSTLQEHGFSPNMVVPHGSYLMNCGSDKPDLFEKSRNMLVDELQRCEALGLQIFNFHPGSTCGKISVDECLDKIADCINHALDKTSSVVAVVENMCCQGDTVGGKFSELGGIIDRVKDKSRVGVCLDTCHAFAAGYDISTAKGYDNMMTEFEELIGLQYLKAVHINDSKGVAGCHTDRHETIGKGKIGMQAFGRIMNDCRFNNIPFVLETPQANYSMEIENLYSLIK